jgi:RNA polymerase sigma factor (sigma-70 family)
MDLESGYAGANLAVRARSVAQGEAKLFEDLYVRHYADVFRYALVLTSRRDDAEDVVAETYARAWRAWKTGREPEAPSLSWLLAIARNLATDRWRRVRKAADRLAVHRDPNVQTPTDSLVWFESLVQILPPRQREVLVLRYYRDLSDAEIGRLMRLSESGVRSLAARAIVTLRRHPEIWQ